MHRCHRDRRQAAHRTLWLLLALLLIILVPQIASARQTPYANTGDDLALYSSIIASQRGAISRETAEMLPVYRLRATFTPANGPELATVTGSLELRYVNSTGVDQPALYLRLYPNDASYQAGGMTIDRVSIDGITRIATLHTHQTVAKIVLDEPVRPGNPVDLSLEFSTQIPTAPSGTYGMFGFDSASGVYALANWFPILAGYDPVGGWLIGPPAVIGDPVFANTALFGVELTAPRAFIIAAGGTEAGETAASPETTTHRYISGPARDFVIATSDRFQTVSTVAGETTVTSYFLAKDAAAGANALSFGARALQTYSDRFGVYPYRRFSLVEVAMGPGAAGVEFPELVFLGSGSYANTSSDVSTRLDFVVAHEVAHQWWYGLVGDDQYLHAFLDEALANLSAVLEFEQIRGAPAAARQWSDTIVAPYRSYLTGHSDLAVDAPSEGFPSVQAYNAIVYGKAVVGFAAIRDAVGPTVFQAGLRLYVERFRFKTAQPDDLLACFNEASGVDLSSRWAHWFNETHGLENVKIATPGTPTREQSS